MQFNCVSCLGVLLGSLGHLPLLVQLGPSAVDGEQIVKKEAI